MRITVQNAVCEFVREIMSARTGETLALKERPDVEHRNIKAPDELWHSATRRYAVEHTLLESFAGQIANVAKIEDLLAPVQNMLTGAPPGYFVLAVRERETSVTRVTTRMHYEVARRVLDAARRLTPGEIMSLRSVRLPFEMRLELRHHHGSRLVIYSEIDGEPEDLRDERVRRAFDHGASKFPVWAGVGYTSVLVLEANDFQHANVFVNFAAVKRVLSARADHPDVIVLVETDGSPMYGWMLKEGERLGDAIPMPDGRRCYTEGQVR